MDEPGKKEFPRVGSLKEKEQAFDETMWKARMGEMRAQACIWAKDLDYGYYDTRCGNTFEFNEGDVDDNGFDHCPYCGGYIDEVTKDEQ